MEQVPYFRPAPIAFSEIEQAMRGIVDSRVYTKGEHRYTLERELSDYIGVDHVIATGSGTAALWITMRMLRRSYGCTRVAMPAFNWGSDAIAVDAAGCAISWTDIDPDTWLSDTPVSQHSGVLALDTFGNVDTSDYHESTVYDATHSLGAMGVGSRGVAECFSMAATKMVPAGEGGFITTNDLYIAQKCTELRDLCSRIPEMSCVVAIEYLSHLAEMLIEKRKIADYYRKHLPYQFQKIPHDSTHSKICFLCDNSTELIERAAKNGVECRKYYQPLVDLPHSSDVYDRIVCLPSYQKVDVARVVAAIETIS